ncbi:hypothetical protein [Actinoplanes derwentensis]|uniref:hypothetical protein n=1 Tax=Actinoplanes derwentensis TaxID=113562 RepID=UPI001A4D95E7|nr:hypothetical protein [Actinoplanes derwentensis]GID82060.1 hypothetical protein Ade03nite_09840 [Actinoplanes derwentensis]
MTPRLRRPIHSRSAAVLTVLSSHTALAYAGTGADRVGRKGAAFALGSTAAGGHTTYMLLIDPDTGWFLAYEQILTAGPTALDVELPAVLSYRTYLQAESITKMP